MEGMVHKRVPREVRSVLSSAREVRIRFHDAHVLFGTVLHRPRSLAEPESDEEWTFTIQPWGTKAPVVLRFDDVATAAPVRNMRWQMQRDIRVAQMSMEARART
jgi:hypothetical protein